MTTLRLAANQLNGSIPSALGALSELRYLNLSDNQLSGNIPPTLGALGNLLALDLHNNQLDGSIPTSLGALSALESLDLYQNQLSGSIPPELGALGQLEYLNLHHNRLSGEIPDTLGTLGNLLALDLYQNRLNGSIPGELGALSELRYLNLSDNQLSGSIPPALGALGNLLALDLHNNQLDGSIPPEIGSLSALESLDLYQNQLSGSIPSELGALDRLEYLNLHHNRLSGNLPDTLGTLGNLVFLKLNGNQLTGHLPPYLCALDLYQIEYNRFNGAAPCTVSAWIETQTIPPTNVAVHAASPVGLSLAWTPLPYLQDGGHYEVWGAVAGEPYQLLGRSASKSDRGLTVQRPPVPSDEEYCVMVRTITLAHSLNPNALTSEPSSPVCTTLPPLPAASLLALYALAFDTPPARDLSWGYRGVMAGLQAASAAETNKLVVALVDLPGPANTFIYIFQAGQSTLVAGLPDTMGTLTPNVREYDMTDGATLGGFLIWARAAYPTNGPTTFSYVGHGGALVPDTDFAGIFERAEAEPGPGSPLFPLPVRVDVNPEFTDITPSQSLLSVYQLGEALRIGSQDGTAPFALVDLVKCMAGTLEEFYALAPYAATLTSAPTYSYFAPEMLGLGLTAISPTAPPGEMAQALIARYDSVIASYDDPDTPADDHPRLLVAVATDEILALKQTWDEVAYYVMEHFDRARLEAAYRQSAHYDTTSCPPLDWGLAVPDALVDLDTFAAQLSQEFGEPVSVPANTLRVLLNEAILAHHAHNGVPWFAEGNPTWHFTGRAGIALYADFVGQSVGADRHLSWHAHFYTDTVSLTNPHPYAFLQGGFKGATWADVFYRFWMGTPDLQTSACLPTLPPPVDISELAVTAILQPRPATVTNDTPIHVVAAVSTSHLVLNPTIAFTITQQNQVVYTDTVAVAYLVTGTHPIYAQRLWTPTLGALNTPESFTLEVMVDSAHQVLETNELDNLLTLNDVVAPSLDYPQPMLNAMLADGNPWLAGSTVTLKVEQDARTRLAPVQRLEVQLHQFGVGSDPTIRLPALRHTFRLSDVNLSTPLALPLPPTVQPGVVLLTVWGWSLGGASVWHPDAVVPFNYTPPNLPIAAGQNHYFLFDAARDESVTIHLDVPAGQEADLFAWDPYAFAPPNPTWGLATALGDDILRIEAAPFEGQYLLAVYGVTHTPYTLSVTHESGGTIGSQTVRANKQGFLPPAYRPLFLAPLPRAPTSSLVLPLIMR